MIIDPLFVYLREFWRWKRRRALELSDFLRFFMSSYPFGFKCIRTMARPWTVQNICFLCHFHLFCFHSIFWEPLPLERCGILENFEFPFFRNLLTDFKVFNRFQNFSFSYIKNHKSSGILISWIWNRAARNNHSGFKFLISKMHSFYSNQPDPKNFSGTKTF